jgi:membrane associated rhomboid family serine protease
MEYDGTHTYPDQDQWMEIPFGAVAPGLPGGPDSRQIRQWALVLDSRAVPCQIQVRDDGWCLLVPPEQYESALHELLRYQENNRNWPPPGPRSNPLVENTLATLSILILLATFHNITQLDVTEAGVYLPDWVALGSARAGRILDGEWWRLVTALTLHADWAHLSANLAIGGIFTVFLCRELGSGLAWSLLLSAGVLGNLVNAVVQPESHSSVGASTAVFGVVGLLAAISLVRYRHQLRHRWPLPIAAALALLAILGSEGKNTDLGAHLFGCIYGWFLGLITEYLINRYGRPGRLANALLALVSTVVVVTAWWLALTSAVPR